MKKPYQIEAQRGVKQLEAMAAEGNPAVQMVLPMAEMVGWLRKGVGELIRQAGLQLMDLLSRLRAGSRYFLRSTGHSQAKASVFPLKNNPRYPEQCTGSTKDVVHTVNQAKRGPHQGWRRGVYRAA